jgi:hypothetical protein
MAVVARQARRDRAGVGLLAWAAGTAYEQKE